MSVLTSNEKLFAEWMMHLKFNQTIQAEPCLSGLQEPFVGNPSKEEIREIWTVRVGKEQISKSAVDGPKHQAVKNQIQNVKKLPSGENGHGKICFKVAKKLTGYFLVENCLVVSADRGVFKVKTVASKAAEELEEDASKIVEKVQDWFDNQRKKLVIASKTSLAVLALFSLMGKLSSDSQPLVATALPIGCIAMCAMNVYLSVRLYQLHSFKDELNSIENLGDWVWKIRLYAREYPDLRANAPNHIHKFFTPDE
jgi:hypothetical protein